MESMGRFVSAVAGLGGRKGLRGRFRNYGGTVMSIIGNPIITGGGNGNTKKPWNHAYFEVTSEEERTTAFVISNNKQVSEILALGEVYFDSYDGIVVKFQSNEAQMSNQISVSTTNKYFAIRLWRAGSKCWHGVGGANQWGLPGSWGTLISPRSYNEGNTDIRIGSMWLNKTMLEGTKIDVWWR